MAEVKTISVSPAGCAFFFYNIALECALQQTRLWSDVRIELVAINSSLSDRIDVVSKMPGPPGPVGQQVRHLTPVTDSQTRTWW